MDSYQEEREIDLKQLFFTVLAKWRVLLVCALIGAVLGGVWQTAKNMSGVQQAQPAPEAVSGTGATDEAVPEEYSEYLRDKAYYESMNRFYSEMIANDEGLLAKQSRYQEDSVYARLDPNGVATAAAFLFIIPEGDDYGTNVAVTEGGSAVLSGVPSGAYRALAAYESAIGRDIDYVNIAERFDTEPQFIRELVSVSRDVVSCGLRIAAYGEDDEMAEAILGEVLSQAEAFKAKVEKTAGRHRLEILRNETTTGIERSLQATRFSEYNNLQTIRNRLATNRDALKNLTMPEEPAGYVVEGTAEDKEAEETQIVVTHTAGFNVREVVKFTVIGCFGGFFLAAFLYALYYILSGRVLSADEFNRRYRIKALTVLPGIRKSGIDAKIASMGNDKAYLNMTEEERIRVAASNFSVYAPDVKDVIVVGSVAAEALEAVANLLRERIADVNFTCAANINENAASLEALKAHSHVILVERALASVYGEVDREMQQLADWGKTVIGSVVVY